jgi:hypothetical protein
VVFLEVAENTCTTLVLKEAQYFMSDPGFKDYDLNVTIIGVFDIDILSYPYMVIFIIVEYSIFSRLSSIEKTDFDFVILRS